MYLTIKHLSNEDYKSIKELYHYVKISPTEQSTMFISIALPKARS